MTTPDPILDCDLDAYVDGQLSASRRVAVETHLSQHPEAAARVMADLGLRGALRMAHAGESEIHGRPETRDAARRLEGGLSNAQVISTLRRIAAVGLLIAVGWAANAGLGPFRATEVVASVPPPAYVEEALRAHQTTLLREAMPSQAAIGTYAPEEIRSATAIVLPTLPEGWQVHDVQVFPSKFGPSVEMALDSGRGERLSLFAVRPGYFAVEKVAQYSIDGTAAAYWQVGDVAYALVSHAGTVPLDKAASDLARSLY